MPYRYDACPHCGVSLLGDPVPETEQPWFGNTHYRRDQHMVVKAIYDGVLYFQCPDCGGAWHRWYEGTKYYEQAQPHITAANAARESV